MSNLKQLIYNRYMKMNKEIPKLITDYKPYTRLLKGLKGISIPNKIESALYARIKGSLCLSENVKPYLCLCVPLKPCLCLCEGDYTTHFKNWSALKKHPAPYSILPHVKLFLTNTFSQSLVNQINILIHNPFLHLKRSFVRRENSPFSSLFGAKNLNFYFTFINVTH